MNDIFTYDVITQAVGIIASLFIIYSFTHKVDNHLKYFMMAGNFFFVIHFFMLAAYAGMAVAIINCFRVALSIKFHRSNKMMFSFMAIYIVTGCLIYESPSDVLPIISSLAGTFALYKLSGIKLRAFSLIGSCSWITYGIIHHSIGGILTESSVMAINLTTITRLLLNKKKQAHEQNTPS